MERFDVAVVGGGPAGLAAAIEAKKNGAESVCVIERDKELGGILQQCIHNGFGLQIFKEDLTGPEYAERFITELKEQNITCKLDTMVLSIDKDRNLDIVNTYDGYMRIKVKAIVLAMGCRERTREAINIPGTRPSGVFTAGTAQRFLNIEGYLVGKKIMMLGTGDIGLIMARRLTLEGAEVKAVLARKGYPGGLMRNVAQCLYDYNIPLMLRHTIVKVAGKDRVEGVLVAKTDEKSRPIPGTEELYECDTLLLSVGLIPENELSKEAGIEIDPATGGPVVNESMETSVGGIFACGNVVHVHNLVDYVTEESRRAGKSAAQFVAKELAADGTTISTESGAGIKYIVPQRIRPANIRERLDLYMRVTGIFKDSKLIVKSGNEVIKSIKKKQMTPGEMERIRIPLNILENLNADVLSVHVERNNT
ncbi:MAG: pyridine nucleotide-disulfide oxidoreductase [Spirochaetes bacterium]|nr:MAG: pyridine nucleotide-disulfide oxidoreductase [Spirochaetota bacterium]